MSALITALKPLLVVVTPQFYTAQFNAVVASTRVSVQQGSAAPLFKAMAVVGVVGYIMEYSLVGRYHVMDKQKIVKAALADSHH